MAKIKGGNLSALKGALTKLQSSKNATSIKVNLKGKQLPSIALLDDFDINIKDAIKQAHHQALLLMAEELEIALGIAMESQVWQWDYGNGDIIDTGKLRDSCNIVVTNDSVQIIYGEEYAGIVHYGGYIHPYGNPNVIIYMPARPWVQAVLVGGGPVPQFDIEGTYAKYAEPLVVSLMKSKGYN